MSVYSPGWDKSTGCGRGVRSRLPATSHGNNRYENFAAVLHYAFNFITCQRAGRQLPEGVAEGQKG